MSHALLRIGIDGRAFSSPAAGIRRYALDLTGALLTLQEPIEVVALGGRRSDVPSGLARVDEPSHPPTNLGWTLVGLPRAASRARVDVLHAPAYTAPYWSPAPVVLTIHDVSYARNPEWYPYRIDPMRRTFYRSSARRAAAVITDSEFSASEIREVYGLDRSRISVVPLGVGRAFAPADTSAPVDLPAGVRSPFVLHVGDLHERRNLATVADAVLEARKTPGNTSGLSLVLAGVDRGVADALCAIAARSGSPEAVVRLGAVSEAELLNLYRGAAALVYPSLYEGFGLPVLEAMACGTPVIASHAASLPEVLGDAGVLLDPHDVPAWTAAIIQLVNDPDRRRTLRERGLHRAASFSWLRTARQTLAVYRTVIRA